MLGLDSSRRLSSFSLSGVLFLDFLGLSGDLAGLLEVALETKFAIGLREVSGFGLGLPALRILLSRDLMSGLGFAGLGWVDVGRLPWSSFLAFRFVKGLVLAFGAPV